ncbi:dCTP deaminase domain-containing protein [Nonomuraea wenchangensis]|uniref:dCTP deaminase n=1 Tax=Nonomuraea wenchangensis TaxID=568860 RepID=UPI0033FA599F
MILTRQAIVSAVGSGDIVIEPFQQERVSPNAYDWRLGEQLWMCDGELDAAVPAEFAQLTIPPEGLLLHPGRLYLGVTFERTHSEKFAQMINGDRSLGALGIWVHVSAPLGHMGHAIRWTLEIRVARPILVYPRMTFGKIIFVAGFGDQASYQQMGRKYTRTAGIDHSRLFEELN